MTQTWLLITTEILVGVLLVFTIAYCYILNKKLGKLKADEMTLKATIVELVAATDIAERAISNLKSTVGDCDRSLTARLGEAKGLINGLETRIKDGDAVVNQIGQIVMATKVSEPAKSKAPPVSESVEASQPARSSVPRAGAAATALAAKALAERVEALVRGEAA